MVYPLLNIPKTFKKTVESHHLLGKSNINGICSILLNYQRVCIPFLEGSNMFQPSKVVQGVFPSAVSDCKIIMTSIIVNIKRLLTVHDQYGFSGFNDYILCSGTRCLFLEKGMQCTHKISIFVHSSLEGVECGQNGRRRTSAGKKGLPVVPLK